MGTRSTAIATLTAAIVGSMLISCNGSEDAWTNEVSVEGLRKGFGGTNGDFDYCDGPNLCTAGEGDCDSNAECTNALCGRDNGPAFGMPRDWDVCVAAHCTNQVIDVDEEDVDCGGADCGQCNPVAGCSGVSGDADFCSHACRCTVNGSGDCDSDLDCGPGLVCKANIGDSFGMPSNYDVCVAAHCRDGVTNADETGRDCGGASCEPCPPPPNCGNGSIEPAETCDDGNTAAGDGCDNTCMVEGGFSCLGMPSVCAANAVVFGSCDDGSVNVTTGFPFRFFASKPTFNQLYVSTNGRVFFSSQGAAMSDPANTALPTVSGNNFLGWWWDDFSLCGADAAFSYSVSGSSPDRVARLVFADLGRSGGAPAEVAQAELRFVETANNIEVDYGANSISVLSGSLGVENAPGAATLNDPFMCNPSCSIANWPAGTTVIFPQQP
jgi:cysteine-rich repeat protein